MSIFWATLPSVVTDLLERTTVLSDFFEGLSRIREQDMTNLILILLYKCQVKVLIHHHNLEQETKDITDVNVLGKLVY